MTVTYTAEVATCRGFGCFLKLLYRWRGSIYKLVWLDLVVFLFTYYILNLSYRLALSEEHKRVFESVVKYCAAYSNLIPLSFVLGFYVTVVMTRWWNQYIGIPWPDSIAVFVSTIIHGQDERGRVMRRTIMRYVCLCLTMVLRNIAPRVKKRFPTLEHLVEAGLLVENERIIMQNLNEKFPPYSKHWLPIVWAASIVTRARKEGRIRDDFGVKTIVDELNKFRGQCGILISYDTISIPLVYTQVVTLAVYSYFLTSVMGQQWVENKTVDNGYMNIVDLYFPVFTTLQFFFYMGWLKVAESLINPFGEDDDDFEVNWMVDRNLQVSYIIVDEMHHDHPELIKDQYWDEVLPPDLPHTIASQKNKEGIPLPSTAKVEVSVAGAGIIPVAPSSVKVNDIVGKSNQSVNNYRFPEISDHEMGNEEDYGINFTAGRNRPNSTGSIHTLSRVATVASALKKFFNREDSRTGQPTDPTARMSVSGSSVSLSKIPPSGGSMRMPVHAIEEVDEQMTITSIRPEVRPTALSIFSHVPADQPTSSYKPPPMSQTPQSAPIDIPKRSPNFPYMRTLSSKSHISDPQRHYGIMPPGGVDELLSTSLPAGDPTQHPIGSVESKKSIESSVSKKSDGKSVKPEDEKLDILDNQPTQAEQDDQFEKLRIAREQEKLERQKLKITRTVSIHQQSVQQPPTTPSGTDTIDTDALVNQLIVAATQEKTKEKIDEQDEEDEPDTQS